MAQENELPKLDQPIKNSAEDALQRGPFAKLVARALLRENKEGGTVIGLSGGWGTGKSSVAVMVVEEIKDRATVVRFDPWMVTATEGLISEFFRTLGKSALPKTDSKEDKEIRARFYDYASKGLAIIATAGKAVSFVLPAAGLAAGAAGLAKDVMVNASEALEAQANDPTLRELRDQIASDLSKLDRPIVVIIDDLDRLERSEVRLMLQLVRCIADFPNVHYLLLYDQAQILDALRDSVHDPVAFLDKIINQAFDLPEATVKQRTQLLDSYLSELGLHEDVPKKAMERLSSLFDEVLLPGLPTMRHIKRYVGTVRALMPGVIKDGHRNVDPADFLALEFIRQYSSSVYNVLRELEGPLPGGRISRLVDREAWKKRIQEQKDKAVEAIKDENRRALISHAIKELNLTGTDRASAVEFSDRRFSSDSWRPVYFGFDESRAAVSEEKWSKFLADLKNPQGAQEWLSEWDDRDQRDQWVSSITSRKLDIPWKDSLVLMEKLLEWGEKHGQEEGRFFSLHHTWEDSVRFCVEALLSVSPDELDPVTELASVMDKADSIIAGGFCVGIENRRVQKDDFERWSKGYEISRLTAPLSERFEKLLNEESIWECSDVKTALEVAQYILGDKKWQEWYNSLPENEARLIKYLERNLGEAESFNYGFHEGPLIDAIRALDPEKLNDAGKKARLLTLDSILGNIDSPASRRRPENTP